MQPQSCAQGSRASCSAEVGATGLVPEGIICSVALSDSTTFEIIYLMMYHSGIKICSFASVGNVRYQVWLEQTIRLGRLCMRMSTSQSGHHGAGKHKPKALCKCCVVSLVGVVGVNGGVGASTCTGKNLANSGKDRAKSGKNRANEFWTFAQKSGKYLAKIGQKYFDVRI